MHEHLIRSWVLCAYFDYDQQSINTVLEILSLLIFSLSFQMFWAGWGEHQKKAKRRRRTRRRTKSQRTPTPLKSPKLTRRERRRTRQQPRLYHQPQHVRTEQSQVRTWVTWTLDECCWPFVSLLPPAIPTEPPTEPEPYTDYPYPDVGEWHTRRDCTEIHGVWEEG